VPNAADAACGTPSYSWTGEYLDFNNEKSTPKTVPIWFEQLPAEFHQLFKGRLNQPQLSKLREIVNLHPEIVQAWMDPSWICTMGKYQDRIYLVALSHQLNKAGKQALETGKLPDAEGAYSLSVAVLPGIPAGQDPNYDAHGQLAVMHSNSGNRKQAATHAAKALEQYRLNEQNNSTAADKLDDNARKSLITFQSEHNAEYAPQLKRWKSIASEK